MDEISALNKVQGQLHMDLPWLWDSFFFFSQTIETQVLDRRLDSLVRLGFSSTSTLLDWQTSRISANLLLSPTRDVSTHCLAVPSHCQHQGNETTNKTPHSNGKLMASWGRREALRLVTVQGTKRLAQLAIYSSHASACAGRKGTTSHC